MTDAEKLAKAIVALRFYSNSSNYDRSVSDRLGYMDPEMWQYDEAPVMDDSGDYARETLAEIL